MKKIVLVILLFASTVSAQTYPVDPSLDSIRTYAFLELNIPTIGTGNVTLVKANLKINLALGTICDEFPAYQKVDTLHLTSDSDGVIVPTDFNRIRTAFRVYNGMRVPMIDISEDSLFNIFVVSELLNAQDTTSYRSPSYFRVHSRKFFTHPVVTLASAFIVDYYAVHPELTSGTDSVQFEPRFFDEFMALVRTNINALREQ